MTRSTYIVSLLILGVQVMSSPGGAANPPFSEHAIGRYLFRVSSGLGEAAGVGSYAIRAFDTNGLDLVAGIVRPRDGELVKSWVVERNHGNTFSVIVWTRVAGSGSYGKLDVVEFNGEAFTPGSLPPPDDALLAGYMGHDTFEVTNGIIYRQFPLYGPHDANSAPSGGSRSLELAIGDETWKLSNHARPPNGAGTPIL